MITFLKLGGSLITDKNKPHTARQEIIKRLAEEIYIEWSKNRDGLIIGHGSGSFGHVPAKQYGTRNGVYDDKEWKGFAEVHSEATALNRIMTDLLREAGLPIISFVPMDNIRTADGTVTHWDITIIEECISHQLIPIVFGDTIFDSLRGGTILSTEDLFTHLCLTLDGPKRILLAGLEEGVWLDYPQNSRLIREIPAGSSENNSYIQGSEFTDVTGGMFEKVRLMKALIRNGNASSAIIFSGAKPDNLRKAFAGEQVGTAILP